jgi:(p)ppGpp synthase/HD superfamily hydrolase
MAASIVRTCRSRGIAARDVDLVSRAHALAMGPRVAFLDDDHHPLYLHPGRTVLVLLADAGVTDPEVLAAAALVESEDTDLRVGGDTVEAEMGSAVHELAAAVPTAESETLAEALVTADRAVRLIAVAERLDHLRHAHLRDDPEWRSRVHAQAVAVYQPIAERTDARLAGRYRHWCRSFQRRFLT